MNNFHFIHTNARRIALILLVCPFSFAGGQQSHVDTILTISEAHIDANHDFIPDRIGQRITVGGRANVYSGAIHTDRLVVFLQDDGSGIELYNTEFGAPIAEGDSVVATGYVEQFEGLTRLSQVTYHSIYVARPMPLPITLSIATMNSEKYEGMLINAFGVITRKWEDAYGSYLCVREHQSDKDSIVVFLFFRHQPGIDFKKFEVGDRVTVTGILAQFARGGALNTGYEIFPRYTSDIELIGVTTRSYLIAIYIIVGVLAVVLLWVWLLRRQVALQTKELRDSENRFRITAEQSGQLVYAYDLDTGIITWAGAIQEVIGFTPDEFQTTIIDWRKRIHPKDYDAVVAYLDEAEKTTSHYFVEYRYRRKNGEYIYVEDHGAYIKNKSGKIYRVLGTIANINERRLAEDALQQERNLLRTVIDKLPDMIFFKDVEGRYILDNLPHLRSLGMKHREDIIGKTSFDFNPPELAKHYMEDEMHVIQSKQEMIGKEELAFHRDTGEQRWHLTSRVPLLDSQGNVTGIVGIARDITEHKQAEAERERLIKELQKALVDIKTLSGLVPICANCKKIRDDKGYWTQIEKYIQDRSEAHFSHGMCPDCMKKLYPDFVPKEKSKE